MQYITETLASPGIPSITTLDIIHGCSSMVWQWEFNGIGSGQYRVRGVSILKVNEEKKVYYSYIEFNSIAWGLDIGFQVIPAALPGQ